MMPKSARLLTLLGKTFTIDIELKDKVCLLYFYNKNIIITYTIIILFIN